MKKEDFSVGMPVYLYLVGNEARGKKSIEEKIVNGTVKTIGKKYINVIKEGYGDYWSIQFDMTNKFLEKTDYGRDYILFINKQDVYDMIEKQKLFYDLSEDFKRCNSNDFTLEQLKQIQDILTNRIK